MFSLVSTFPWLLVARSLQGVASACVAVAGMGMIAHLYDDEKERSKVTAVAVQESSSDPKSKEPRIIFMNMTLQITNMIHIQRNKGSFGILELLSSKVMGNVLGGIAAGVLIGYPFGGVLYDFRVVTVLELEAERI